MFFFFYFLFPFSLPLPVLQVFSSLFDSSLWPCLRESFLLLQFRETVHAAEVGGNYSRPWRLCRLPCKTKTKIFHQQVAAWVSTCEIPAQPTLGNLPYSIFRQQIILFHPPRFSPPETDFPSCNAPEATDFSAPSYKTLSEGYALKSYFYLPI